MRDPIELRCGLSPYRLVLRAGAPAGLSRRTQDVIRTVREACLEAGRRSGRRALARRVLAELWNVVRESARSRLGVATRVTAPPRWSSSEPSRRPARARRPTCGIWLTAGP